MMKMALDEEIKRKAHTLHGWVVGWSEKGSPQKMPKSRNEDRHIHIFIALAWRVGEDEFWPNSLISHI